MDTVTQFALGACVGAAVAGPRVGVRRAAMAGGVLGVLPDVDVFWPFEDAIERFVLHRSVTHSLVIHALVTPIFAEGLARLAGVSRGARPRMYLAVFLCLATHALLDSMTIYGTRLFWPIWPEAVGLGSVYIIDPVYTLPLLFATVWALLVARWNAAVGRVLGVALAVSTAYLSWSAAAQSRAESRAKSLLAEARIAPDRIVATPTPFNTLFWRVIAVHGSQYFNIYVPLFGAGGTETAYRHPRRPPAVECLGWNGAVERLIAFTDGFYRLEAENGVLAVADLRMGLTPRYVFRFVVAEHAPVGFRETTPRRIRTGRTAPGDIDWLKAGILGRRAIRPAEADRAVDLKAGVPLQTAEARETAC